MDKEDFLKLLNSVVSAGYSQEIEWQRNLRPCADSEVFFMETCWVILNSGMKEQIARKIWNRIQDAWAVGQDISEVFGHTGKVAAIKYVRENKSRLFSEYLTADDKLSYLEKIPFIGKITKYHLAKNLGHDCVKPDRHLVRIAAMYGKQPDEFCEKLSEETREKKCVIDIVLWRAANLKFI
jgi:hypothetical protein